MSIYKYEESIVNKLREITGDNRIIITPSDNIINIIPRITSDELKLPLIHIVRNKWGLRGDKPHGLIKNGNVNDSFPMFVNGDYVSCKDGKVHRIHAIPITFSHSFEVWSKTREENDEMMRELIWFFSTLNEFEVEIPYGLNLTHKFTLNLQPDIVDSTDVLSHQVAGELFLQACITTCDDAYLWKSSAHNPTCIHIDSTLSTINNFKVNEVNYNILTTEQQEMEMKHNE